MNNGNKKFHDLAAGWIKTRDNGTEFVSFASSGERSKVKLLAQLENGDTVTVRNFFMQENSKQNERQPDYRLVMITDED